MNDNGLKNEYASPVGMGGAAKEEAKAGNTLEMGPVIGTIIVILVLIVGGLYFLGQRVSQEGLLAPDTEDILTEPDAALDALTTSGTSDEVGAIEEDLNATPIENLDVELGNIGRELGL